MSMILNQLLLSRLVDIRCQSLNSTELKYPPPAFSVLDSGANTHFFLAHVKNIINILLIM